VPDTLTPWEGELAVQTIAAVDLGTTSCRAEVFSLDGEPLGRHSVEYSVDTPVPGAAEQDAETWWQAACECLRGALQRAGAEGKDVLAVGFSCQGHSWVPTDAGFRPLRPAFTWLDQRAARQAQSLLDEAGAECWGALAGKTPGPWHMLPQILWMREHEHDVINRAQHLLFVQDFLIARLTGRPATDYTTAAATLFFDITSNAWDGATLDRYRIAMRSLPEVVASGTAVGTVTHDAAAATGLSTETVVVTGAQDQKCAAFGAGLAPGIATASLGTATAIEALMDRPAFDVNVPIPCFPYLQADTWVLEAAITPPAGRSTGSATRCGRSTRSSPTMSWQTLPPRARRVVTECCSSRISPAPAYPTCALMPRPDSRASPWPPERRTSPAPCSIFLRISAFRGWA